MSEGADPTGAADYRYDPLDGVRGIAAQVVLVGHLGGLAWPEAPALVLTALSWLSRLAVMAFFVLSGLVIALSLRKLIRESGRGGFLLPYAVHRWARIFPPLAFAVAITFAVGIMARSAGLTLPGLRSPEYELGVLAFLRGITLTFAIGDATFALDGPLWSLRQEVWLYVIAAAAALGLAWRGWTRFAAFALVAAMVAATSRNFFYPQSLALFAAGAAASLWGASPPMARLARSSWTALVLAALLAIPLAVWPPGPGFAYGLSNDPLFLAYQAALAVPIALVLLGIATRDGPVSRFLSRWKSAGSFSYTLYVVHNPVLVLLYALLAPLGLASGGWKGALAALLAIAVVEILAYGAARLFERPKRFRALAWRGLALVGAKPPRRSPAPFQVDPEPPAPLVEHSGRPSPAR